MNCAISRPVTGPPPYQLPDGGCAEHALCAINGSNPDAEYECKCDNGYEGNPYGVACTGEFVTVTLEFFTNTNKTRKSSCVNARGIPPAV